MRKYRQASLLTMQPQPLLRAATVTSLLHVFGGDWPNTKATNFLLLARRRRRRRSGELSKQLVSYARNISLAAATSRRASHT